MMASVWLLCLSSLLLTESHPVVDRTESVFTLSPSVAVIAFSNYTTNNPLDNLKDFPDTWHPDFDVHEFSLNRENGVVSEQLEFVDQLAVESQPGSPGVSTVVLPVTAHPEDSSSSVKVSITSSHSSTSAVRVTAPYPTPTPGEEEETSDPSVGTVNSGASLITGGDAFSSLYSGVGVEWSDEPRDDEERESSSESSIPGYNSDLYHVVTDGPLDLEEPTEEQEQLDYMKEDKYDNLLNQLQKKYGGGEEEEGEGGDEHMEDMKHPLIMLMKIEPHAMDLLVKPKKFVPNTMVRLMYERVPRNRPPLLQHLTDPVVEYVPLQWPEQHHKLQNLPMGKYIVCGEAHTGGQLMQGNCFQTIIDRLDNNMLQGGVIGVICIALLIVFLVLVYAIYHRVVRNKHTETQGNPEPQN